MLFTALILSLNSNIFSASELQTFDNLNSTRPSPARPNYLKIDNLCRKTNENVRNKSRLLKSAYVRAFSARPTTCLAAEGKIRELTPPIYPHRKIDQPSAVVSTRTLPSWHAGIFVLAACRSTTLVPLSLTKKWPIFEGGVRWAAKIP